MDRLLDAPRRCDCGNESGEIKSYMQPFIARMCNDCRTTYWRVKDRRRRGRPAVADRDFQPPCEECGCQLVKTSKQPKRLCDNCKTRSWTKRPNYGLCVDCSKPKEYIRNKLCDDCRSKRKRDQWRRKNTARRSVRTLTHDGYTIAEVAERDNWTCHLCGRKVPKKSPKSWHPMKASIDHIVPISDGGHDVRSNVRLAHLHCNIKRGDGGAAQLLLIG